MRNQGCTVRLIVRRCLATSPDALRELLDVDGVHVKFTDGRWLHSKFFMFDNGTTIVGSANLTISGLDANHESGVIATGCIDSSELLKCFEALWADLDVHELDLEAISELEAAIHEARDFQDYLERLEKDMLNRPQRNPPKPPTELAAEAIVTQGEVHSDNAQFERILAAARLDPMFSDLAKNQREPLKIGSLDGLCLGCWACVTRADSRANWGRLHWSGFTGGAIQAMMLAAPLHTFRWQV